MRKANAVVRAKQIIDSKLVYDDFVIKRRVL